MATENLPDTAPEFSQQQEETLALAIALQDRLAAHGEDPTAKHLADILVRTAGGLSADY
jgi:hypothetical protein